MCVETAPEMCVLKLCLKGVCVETIPEMCVWKLYLKIEKKYIKVQCCAAGVRHAVFIDE